MWGKSGIIECREKQMEKRKKSGFEFWTRLRKENRERLSWGRSQQERMRRRHETVHRHHGSQGSSWRTTCGDLKKKNNSGLGGKPQTISRMELANNVVERRELPKVKKGQYICYFSVSKQGLKGEMNWKKKKTSPSEKETVNPRGGQGKRDLIKKQIGGPKGGMGGRETKGGEEKNGLKKRENYFRG